MSARGVHARVYSEAVEEVLASCTYSCRVKDYDIVKKRHLFILLIDEALFKHHFAITQSENQG